MKERERERKLEQGRRWRRTRKREMRDKEGTWSLDHEVEASAETGKKKKRTNK